MEPTIKKQTENKNSISITAEGVVVESNNATLKEIEKTINRLIKKHENFMVTRKINKSLSGVN